MSREATLRLPPGWAAAPRLTALIRGVVAAVDTLSLRLAFEDADGTGATFVAPPLFVYGTGSSYDSVTGVDRARESQAHPFTGRVDVSDLRRYVEPSTAAVRVIVQVEDRDGQEIDPAALGLTTLDISLVPGE